jgi:hypothetical protein
MCYVKTINFCGLFDVVLKAYTGLKNFKTYENEIGGVYKIQLFPVMLKIS